MGKWTRRAFISAGVLAGGAVIFGVAIRPGNRADEVLDLIAEDGDVVMNIWLKIAPDNLITAFVPHAEMGQGVLTALGMMLADELDADWDRVKIVEAPAEKEYANYAMAKGFVSTGMSIPSFLDKTVEGMLLMAVKSMDLQITGGSGSVRFTGREGMRVAGASAKAMLLQAAAEQWGVPQSELKASKSYISHSPSGKSAPYAEFAAAAAKLTSPSKPTLKSEEAFTIMGTSPPRIDIPAKVDGTAQFGIDTNLPGMKYATIKASPVFGQKIINMDASMAEEIAGVHKVLNLEDACAVVADGYWTAKKALGKVSVEFETNEKNQISQDHIFEQFSKALDEAVAKGDEEKDIMKGDIKAAQASADRVFSAEYRVPYLAHATMEPMNCTAWIHDNICEIWIGTQNPLGTKGAAAEFLNMDYSQIRVHNQFLGGGFGRRAENDVLIQCLKIAKEVDAPVKLIWSREEDIQHDVYRDANISRFSAALDEKGNPATWVNQYLFKHHPAEATQIPYQIDNQYVHYTHSPTHIPWGNWRSVDHSHHGFFIESFIDELAHEAGKDPFEFRRNLLAHEPRFQKVLETAAEKSGWGRELPSGWGRGIAIHESFGTIVAEVVHAEVLEDGRLKVHEVFCAADAGFAIHPDGFVAQMESGIIYGLTAALYGEITIENGAVAQSNFHDYQMVRMNDAPRIQTFIINSGNQPGGGGEPGTPAIAPALANAIFNATGKRIRELPVKNHDLKRPALDTEKLG